MKVVCKIRAFSQNRIIVPGEILELQTDKCPSWAKEIVEAPENKAEDTVIVAGDGGVHVIPQDENKTQEGTVPPKEAVQQELQITVTNELAQKSEEELAEMLDDLITRACEKEVIVDGLEKLSVIEQIQTLELELMKKGVEQ